MKLSKNNLGMFHFQVTSDPHVFENEKLLFLLEISIFQFRINMQMKQSNKRLLLNKLKQMSFGISRQKGPVLTIIWTRLNYFQLNSIFIAHI